VAQLVAPSALGLAPSPLQANVDRAGDPAEWRLDALASKMVQYCPLLEELTGAELAANSKVGNLCQTHLQGLYPLAHFF